MQEKLIEKRWILPPIKESLISTIVENLGISRLQSILLINRGIITPEAAYKYLHPKIEDLHNPFLMKDMEKVVKRIFKAIENGEKILIYGDFDVDGITSVSVLQSALEELGAKCKYFIPQRLSDGYGLKEDVIIDSKKQGFSLVISVDCGIRATEVAEKAKEIGIDLIITDHHLPGEKIPDAYAILNPKQKNCTYPEKNLAGVGVVFKLIEALFTEKGFKEEARKYLKIVAIGTIADIVSLTGENRVIVKYGLMDLKNTKNIGLKTLLEFSGLKNKDISCMDVAFKVAPRINAVGRMGGTSAAVELFNSSDQEFVTKVVKDMNFKNMKRQHEEGNILKEINELTIKRPEIFKEKIIVVAGENWHRGVIGIVASRLVEKYHRPAIVLSIENGEAHGSSRSTSKFHLLNALKSCNEYLIRYGGHALAAGLTLQSDKIEVFRKKINEYAETVMSEEDFKPELKIDSYLSLSDISFKLVEEINELAPFGEGNPLPVFATENVKLYSGPWLLKEKHLKIKVGNVLQNFDAVWWKKGFLFDELIYQKKISIAYTIHLNEHNGNTTLQLNLKDMKFPNEK